MPKNCRFCTVGFFVLPSVYFELFFLEEEEAPVCVACHVVTRVKHILVECADLTKIRDDFFLEKSLFSLFQNVSPERLSEFLKEIGIFKKI